MDQPVSFVIGAILCGALAGACVEPEPVRESASAPAPDRGSALFARHCAVCHGDDGRGDGPAMQSLFPPARDFTRGRFRLVSTVNGAPTERDLVTVLRRGMPGSAMPSWNWLSDADLVRLAHHVRSLAVGGLADRLVDESNERGEALAIDDARALAARRLEPGPSVPVPDVPRNADRARGEQLFLAHCAPCHGEDARGGSEPRIDEEGELHWARDLTAGFVKGGATTKALAQRIGAGMPGTAMPPTRLSERDLAALVAYVGDLIPDRTDERFVQYAERLRARWVEHALPRDPDDAAWNSADEIQVVLAPLWWRDESIVYASFAALHDGESIALRVRWPDSSGPGPSPLGGAAPDGAALQFSTAEEPALFGMGSAGHPTNFWHWKSARASEASGALELVEGPHGVRWSDRSIYRLLEGVPAVSRTVDELHAGGVGALDEEVSDPRAVRAVPRWSEAEWAVVFTRALAPSDGSTVRFAPGESLQVSIALWNGAAGDRGAQKSISIWHALVLDPKPMGR